MRTAFIKQLTEEATLNNKIFLIVGDLGFNVVEEFSSLFPDRFLNAGVAEQNMTGIASGLAMEGYNVYIYSIGNFPTLRCMEQIRYDIAYHHLPVKIVAVGGGYAYGPLGASHHATEELGMLRTIPNMIVAAPGDPIETKALTSLSVNVTSPMYIRLGKAGESVVHNKEINKLSIGQILTLKKSPDSKIMILTTGSMLNYAMQFVERNKLNCSVYSCPFVKPINNNQLKLIVERYSKIIILEEHQQSAGFGSAIIEQVNDLYANQLLKKYPFIFRRAINDRFYNISGSQSYLREHAEIALRIEDFTINHTQS
jgi:transketolase